MTQGPWRRGVLLGALLALAAPGVARGDEEAARAPMPREDRLKLCASCHDVDGNSKVPENPVLAGLHPRYLVQQLKDFKSGTRKSEVMGVIIAAVDEAEFDGLARYYGKQKPKPTSAKLDPKLVAKGKPIFDDGLEAAGVPACSGCHNEDGSGGPKYPRLAGQHPAYVLRQLQRYKSGERANDQRELMREVAQRLTDDEMRAVAAFIATLKGADE